jgi:hypothetical protein
MREQPKMETQGIYYLAREASQFTSIAPLYTELGGKFLTWKIHKNRVGTLYPFRKWKNLLFPKIRDLRIFTSKFRPYFRVANLMRFAIFIWGLSQGY